MNAHDRNAILTGGTRVHGIQRLSIETNIGSDGAIRLMLYPTAKDWPAFELLMFPDTETPNAVGEFFKPIIAREMAPALLASGLLDELANMAEEDAA